VAATCDICGKGPGFGHSISHSHRRTKRRWNPNIQRVRTLIGATPKRQNVCTSCLTAVKVVRSSVRTTGRSGADAPDGPSAVRDRPVTPSL